MKLQQLTEINLVDEAVQASKARHVRSRLREETHVATRDARAHHLLKHLKPGETAHIASMGELSLHDVAGAIVEYYGPFETLTLATWAASELAIKRLLSLRQAGGVKRLEALVDSRMPTDCADAHAMMTAEFDLYACGSNHAKVMAFTGVSKDGFAVVSTANLTANPRCEVLVVCRGSKLAVFHRDWIRGVLSEVQHAQ